MPHQPHPSTNAAAYAAGYQPSERSRQREFNPQQHPLRPPHRPRQHAGIVPPPHHLPSETTSVDSAKLFRQLPESLKIIEDKQSSWVLTQDCCREIGNGAADVGFYQQFNPAEIATVYGANGILRTKLKVHVSEHSRFSTQPGEKKSSKCIAYLGDGMLIEREILCDYKCQSSGCNCRIKIARVNCNGISGLLGYQLATPGTGLIYEHDQNAHKLFPHEEQSQGLRTLLQKNSTSKFSLFALSVEQKEFIMDYGLTTGTISQQKDAVSTMTFMARMNQMRCTPEQLYTPEKFLSAVKNWVGNRKKQGDYFFSNQWGKCSMSAHQLKELLDLLKTSPDDRTSPPDVSTYPNNPHLLTPEFRETVWPYMIVQSHDHDGSTWTRITFECADWKVLVRAAVQMNPDGTVQLEIDFFRGCCEGDEWQVGQIGFSDLNHRYHFLVMDISKSENNQSAGRLLERALEMLNEMEGD